MFYNETIERIKSIESSHISPDYLQIFLRMSDRRERRRRRKIQTTSKSKLINAREVFPDAMMRKEKKHHLTVMHTLLSLKMNGNI